jgi:hypothetical protein
VLGEEIETVDFNILQGQDGINTMLTITVERVPAALLRSLAAYRLGDQAAVMKYLADLGNTTTLSAGQRAVAAGLLASVGKPERAWEIAEKVPDALLLQEELTFLERAR